LCDLVPGDVGNLADCVFDEV